MTKTARQKANKTKIPQSPKVAKEKEVEIDPKMDQLEIFAKIPSLRNKILAPSEKYPENKGNISFGKLETYNGKDVIVFSAWSKPNRYGQLKVWYNVNNETFILSDAGSAFSEAVLKGKKIPEDEAEFFPLDKHMRINTYKNRFGKIGYSNREQVADSAILSKIRKVA